VKLLNVKKLKKTSEYSISTASPIFRIKVVKKEPLKMPTAFSFFIQYVYGVEIIPSYRTIQKSQRALNRKGMGNIDEINKYEKR